MKRRTVRTTGGLGLNPEYTFESFVQGPENQHAYKAARIVAESPATAYNPVWFRAGTGLGKTHLLQAICQYVKKTSPKHKVRYLSSDEFTTDFVNAIIRSGYRHFLNRYRGVDLLAIDDIHCLASKKRLQEELFHVLEELLDKGKQVVLGGSLPSSDMPVFEMRFLTRFKWGLIINLEPPSVATSLAILKRHAATLDVPIPDDLLRFIAKHDRSSVRRLIGTLTRAAAYIAFTKAPVSVEKVRQLLKRLPNN